MVCIVIRTMSAVHPIHRASSLPPVRGPRTPVSVGIEAPAGVATDRPTGLPRSARGVPADGGPRKVRVAMVGATGYVGAELIRILARHPNVELAGLQGRDRDNEPIEDTHRHLLGTGLTVDSALPEADAVFLALPHGTAATWRPTRAPSASTSCRISSP